MTDTVQPPSRPSSSGRFALVLGAVAAAALLGAALLAPPVAAVVGAAGGELGWPFSRFFDRVAILILVVALIALRRPLGLGRIAEAWRAETWSQRARRASLGLAASLVPALLVMAPAISSSALLWAGRTTAQAAEKLVVALPGALLIALLEESFFRVTVFRGLAATWPWPVAAAVASAFYSTVHFLAPARTFTPAGHSPVEGLSYLAVIVGRVADPHTLPAVTGLFLIGGVLCLALQRGRSLALVVGLHAGWFVAAKVAIRLTTLPPELTGGGSAVKRQLLMASPWLWLAIGATGAVVWAVTRARH